MTDGRTRIIDGLIFLSVVVPVLAFAVVSHIDRRDTLADTEHRLLSNLDTLHESAEKAFLAQRLLVATVAERAHGLDDAAVRADEAELFAFVNRLRGYANSGLAVAILSADGSPLVHSEAFPAPRHVSRADREYFVRHRDDGVELHITEPVRSRQSGTDAIGITMRRSDPSGGFAGVIVSALPVSYFIDFWSKTSPGHGSTVLVRADGRVLARNPAVDVVAGVTLEPDTPLMEAIRAGAERTALLGVSPFDGDKRLYAFRSISGFPIHIGHSVTVSSALAPWVERTLILAAYTAMTVAAMVFLLLMARRQTVRLADAHARAQALNRELEGRVAARTADLERVNAELERRVEERTAQLAQAQKMEAIGHLTGGVAHDFNNVLQSLGSCLFVLDRHVPDGTPRALFDAALRSIERGAGLTQSLLAFARRQTLAPRPTELKTLLERMRPLLERTLGGMIEIRIDAPSGLAALVDPLQLESALLNLSINARDAMPAGGRLTFAVFGHMVEPSCEPGRSPAPTPAGAAPALAPGSYVAVRVADTGTGMDAATLARVFEPFFTTKGRSGTGMGSGLGLSMVHGMAAQSGGGVAIASAPGQGATVTLYLPRAEPAAEPSTAAAAAGAAAAGRGDGRTILLVDDDALVRVGVKAMLEGLGWRVHAVAAGTDALDALRRGMMVDAVITDYAMPGMNGDELAREAVRLRPALPVVVVTGYADGAPDLEHATVLRKPFRSDDLAACLGSIVERTSAVRLRRGGAVS